MTEHPIDVAVNGYGAIGKPIADAVRAMPDMALVGVADVTGDRRIRSLVGGRIAMLAATVDADMGMRAAGVKAVCEGGVAPDATGHCLGAQPDSAPAVGRDMTRVAASNTASTVRSGTGRPHGETGPGRGDAGREGRAHADSQDGRRSHRADDHGRVDARSWPAAPRHVGVAVWEDVLAVPGDEVFLLNQVCNGRSGVEARRVTGG